MDISWHTSGATQKLNWESAFQVRPLIAAIIVAFLLHASAAWYLVQIVGARKAQSLPKSLQFELVTPPQPLPMSPAPSIPVPQQILKPRQEIKNAVSPKLVRPLDPPKRSVETEKKIEKPEISTPPILQSKEPEPLPAPQIEIPPAAPPAPVYPGGGGGGGVGNGNGLGEGDAQNSRVATGPGGGGVGTGGGTGIGSGIGPGTGSGIGEGVGSGTGSGVGSGEGNIILPIFDAAYLSNPIPEYPPAARKLRLQGTVVVRVLVSPEGKPDVVRLEKSSGISSLDGSALKAVKNWSFVPARSGEKAVSAWVDVPIRFHLN